MDIIKSIEEYGGTMFVGAADFTFNNPGAVALTAMVPLALATIWVSVKLVDRRRGLSADMKRKVQLEAHYADRIHDFMFDDLLNGVITRAEYKRDLKRMGIAYKLFDLLRPMKAKKGMKHRIKHNCDVNHSTLQHIRADKIPGPKPGEVTPPPLPAKRRKLYVVAVGGSKRGTEQ